MTCTKNKPKELPCHALRRRRAAKGKVVNEVDNVFFCLSHTSLSDLLEFLTIIQSQINIKLSYQHNETAGHLQCSESTSLCHPVEYVQVKSGRCGGSRELIDPQIFRFMLDSRAQNWYAEDRPCLFVHLMFACVRQNQ